MIIYILQGILWLACILGIFMGLVALSIIFGYSIKHFFASFEERKVKEE